MKKFSGKLLTACLIMILLTALCAACALADTVIDTVKVTMDASYVDLNTAWTEGEVSGRFNTNAGLDTAGLKLDRINSGLRIKISKYEYHGIGDGTGKVSLDTDYVFEYNLKLLDGYDWDSKVKTCTVYTASGAGAPLKVYVNGTLRTDVTFRYNESWNSVEVHVPALKASTSPVVTKVTVWGDGLSLACGDAFTYKKNVEGMSGADLKLKWTVSGQTAAGTKIDQNGRITMGKAETASVITVRATSVTTPHVYDEVKLTVAKKGKVKAFELFYDEAAIHLSTDSTEGEVDRRVRKNVSEGTKGCHLGTMNGLHLLEGVDIVGIGAGTARVDPDKKYYIGFDLLLDSGYAWPGTVMDRGWGMWEPLDLIGDMTVAANGAAWTNVIVDFCYAAEGKSSVRIFVPVPDHLPEIDITRAKVSGIRAKTYTGKALKQDITVKLDGTTLKKGTHYSVTYSDNKNAGEATVKITGLGRYKGTITKHFTIKPVKIKKVVLPYSSKAYAGKALKPEVKVSAAVDGRVTILKKTRDYTVTYKNNKNVGLATVTVTGTGNFTGTIEKTFTIRPVKLGSVTLEYTKAVYTGKAIKPKVTVTAKVDGKTVTLKQGRDYTVSYKNNVKVGVAAVTVTGMGNFTGTITKTFKIIKK